MLVVLALPLFDAIRVIVDRLRQRKNPMQGDYTHLHYRLMALGWDRHEVRWVIW
jgi:UDP-N-acetylmuramyl pentapeptide phosphotransferase/UDP-N-acetylglucosamine-1-phosphate transferase